MNEKVCQVEVGKNIPHLNLLTRDEIGGIIKLGVYPEDIKKRWEENEKTAIKLRKDLNAESVIVYPNTDIMVVNPKKLTQYIQLDSQTLYDHNLYFKAKSIDDIAKRNIAIMELFNLRKSVRNLLSISKTLPLLNFNYDQTNSFTIKFETDSQELLTLVRTQLRKLYEVKITEKKTVKPKVDLEIGLGF